jgi:hypothetical protein
VRDGRSPRVMRVTFTLMPAASTSAPSVQVSGFEDIRLLTRCGRLLCDSCSSGQCFACGFLQIPPHDGHPCRPANRSPCRADGGLAPPGHSVTTTVTETAPVKALRAMPGARNKRAGSSEPGSLGLQREEDQSTLKKATGPAWQTGQGPCGSPSRVLPQILHT